MGCFNQEINDIRCHEAGQGLRPTTTLDEFTNKINSVATLIESDHLDAVYKAPKVITKTNA